jgi:hypothetical protein
MAVDVKMYRNELCELRQYTIDKAYATPKAHTQITAVTPLTHALNSAH